MEQQTFSSYGPHFNTNPPQVRKNPEPTLKIPQPGDPHPRINNVQFLPNIGVTYKFIYDEAEVQAAIREEREACANVADTHKKLSVFEADYAAALISQTIAIDIRARSNQ